MLDALIVVEDPGAANYVAELPSALADNGWRAGLMASGSAIPFLRIRGAAVEALSQAQVPSELLDVRNPALVVVGTSEDPDGIGLGLIAAARQRRIPCLAVVDAPSNASHRLTFDDPTLG